MSELPEFLLARIAEDEAEARHRDLVTFGAEQRAVAGTQGAFDPARVRAECRAKRQIVEREMHSSDPAWCYSCGGPSDECPTLRILAAVYADHPDYDPAWYPEA